MASQLHFFLEKVFLDSSNGIIIVSAFLQCISGGLTDLTVLIIMALVYNISQLFEYYKQLSSLTASSFPLCIFPELPTAGPSSVSCYPKEPTSSQDCDTSSTFWNGLEFTCGENQFQDPGP